MESVQNTAMQSLLIQTWRMAKYVLAECAKYRHAECAKYGLAECAKYVHAECANTDMQSVQNTGTPIWQI